MNREILFRGKRADNGEWIKGCLYPNGKWLIVPEAYKDAVYIGNNNLLKRIFPDTVGRYTGLRDKSGKKIFEGDILANFVSGDHYVVIYDKKIACFSFENTDISKDDVFSGIYIFDLWHNNEFELDIIGNIHDNPELLKKSRSGRNAGRGAGRITTGNIKEGNMTIKEVLHKIEGYIRERDDPTYSFELTEEDADIIKAALVKQIPKSPVPETDKIFGDITIVCPDCGNCGLANPFIHSVEGFKYCPQCGQRLRWNLE